MFKLHHSLQDSEDSHYTDAKELPIFQFFDDDIGPWPLLHGKVKGQLPVERLIGTLAAYQVHSFVDVYVTPDEKNSPLYTIQVWKVGFLPIFQVFFFF